MSWEHQELWCDEVEVLGSLDDLDCEVRLDGILLDGYVEDIEMPRDDMIPGGKANFLKRVPPPQIRVLAYVWVDNEPHDYANRRMREVVKQLGG